MISKLPVPQKNTLSSERFISDTHFSKDATFIHVLKNNADQPIEVFTQDYFIDSLKPFMHELKIQVRSFNNSNRFLMPISSYKASVKYMRVDKGTAENLVTVSGIMIPA